MRRSRADVERLLAARLRDAHDPGAARLHRRARARALVAEDPGARPVESRPSAMLSAACELVPISGSVSASRSSARPFSIRPRPKCAPMPARSTFGDQSEAVPSSAITWPKPKAAALRRMRADVAGVLDPVENDRGGVGRSAGARRQGHDEGDRRRRSRACSARPSPRRRRPPSPRPTPASAACAPRCQAVSLTSACSAGGPPRATHAWQRCSPSSRTWPSLR